VVIKKEGCPGAAFLFLVFLIFDLNDLVDILFRESAALHLSVLPSGRLREQFAVAKLQASRREHFPSRLPRLLFGRTALNMREWCTGYAGLLRRLQGADQGLFLD
jgi:hypothetical protein